MLRGLIPLVAMSALCVSCNDAAIDPSQSLVGAKELPSAKTLSHEAILISLGLGDSPKFLTYELRPDNSLIITHTARTGGAEEKVRGKETLRLSAKVAAQARQQLWKLRPAALDGVEWEIRPKGCGYALHDFPESSVVFIAEGPEPGTEDDRLGLATLPYPRSCNNREAVEARQLLRQVLQSFPSSKVASDFERSA